MDAPALPIDGHKNAAIYYRLMWGVKLKLMVFINSTLDLIFLPTGFMLSCREDVYFDPILSLEITHDRTRHAS